jgi:hypothetical protein
LKAIFMASEKNLHVNRPDYPRIPRTGAAAPEQRTRALVPSATADTSICISGLLSSGGLLARFLELARAGVFVTDISDAVVRELLRVQEAKFQYSKANREHHAPRHACENARYHHVRPLR